MKLFLCVCVLWYILLNLTNNDKLAMVKHEAAMDYLRQIKAFSTFSQLFETRGDQVKVDNAVFK